MVGSWQGPVRDMAVLSLQLLLGQSLVRSQGKNPTAKAISEVILEQAAWPRALVAGSSARPSLGIALVSDSSLGRGEHPGIWGAPLGTPQPS